MVALECDESQSMYIMKLFRVNTTLLSLIAPVLLTQNTGHETLFSVSVLLWIIALEFNDIKSKYRIKLFRVKLTLISWIVVV